MIIIGAIWRCFCINTTMSLPQLVPGSPLHSVGTDYHVIAGPAASNERPFAPENESIVGSATAMQCLAQSTRAGDDVVPTIRYLVSNPSPLHIPEVFQCKAMI